LPSLWCLSTIRFPATPRGRTAKGCLHEVRSQLPRHCNSESL
jgi:hypothetical protein